jgi:hypothetical protein
MCHCSNQAEAELLQAIVLLFQRLGITSLDVGIRVSSRKVTFHSLNYPSKLTFCSKYFHFMFLVHLSWLYVLQSKLASQLTLKLVW